MTLGSPATSLTLGISIAGLPAATAAERARAGGPKPAIDWAASLGLRHVQLDAAMPGLRPRELDRSARRDLVAFMRRREVAPSGLDLWIPAAHFASGEHSDRAVAAVTDAITLAAETAGLAENPAAAVVSLTLGESCPPAVIAALDAAADAAGVMLADHTPAPDNPDGQGATDPRPPSFGVGIDPATILLAGGDPAQTATAVRTPVAAARLADAADGVRTELGRGGLDALTYAMSLTTIGYQRPVTIDCRGLPDATRAAQTAIAAWREATTLPGI